MSSFISSKGIKPSWMPDWMFQSLSDPTNVMMPIQAPVKAGASALSKAIAPTLGRSMETFSNVLPVKEGMGYLKGLGGVGKNSLAALAKKWQPGPALASVEMKPPMAKMAEKIPSQGNLLDLIPTSLTDNISSGVDDLASKLRGYIPENSNAFAHLPKEMWQKVEDISRNPFRGYIDDAGNIAAKAAKTATAQAAEKATPVANATAGRLSKAIGLARKYPKTVAGGTALGGYIGYNQLSGTDPEVVLPGAPPPPQNSMRSGSPIKPPNKLDIESLLSAIQPPQSAPMPDLPSVGRGWPGQVPQNMGELPGMDKQKGKGIDWKTILQIAGPLLAAILMTRGSK